jgi:hypothetical protein
LLHRKLGIPEGQKIPEARLKSAERSSDPSLRREAQFADNARGFSHDHAKVAVAHAKRVAK